MFMHGSWSHMIGNLIFLWAFAPEIQDAIGRGRYLVFYLVGGLVAMLAQVLADRHSTVPNLGASEAIAAVMGAFLVTYPRDQIRTLLFIFVFTRFRFIPAALLIGLLISPSDLPRRRCGTRGDGWGGILGAYRWLRLRGCHCKLVRGPASKRVFFAHISKDLCQR